VVRTANRALLRYESAALASLTGPGLKVESESSATAGARQGPVGSRVRLRTGPDTRNAARLIALTAKTASLGILLHRASVIELSAALS
jgi:hypothetical protein